MNLRRTRTMARKELLHILRDPRSLLMALALPLLMILLFGYALTLDVDRIPTLILDQDQSPESRALIARFEGSRFFEVGRRVEQFEEIRRAIDEDSCMLGVVIQRDFGGELLAGRKAPVQLLFDGSNANTASIALGYTDALVQGYNLDLRVKASNRVGAGRQGIPVDGQLRVWYNSELKSKNYVVPGLIALIMMIISALLTSLTIAREWEMGTMEQLLSTPLRPAEVVLGKMTAFFALGIIDMAVAIFVGVVIFRVPMRGSYILLVGTACVFLVGALFWGILLSAATRSQLLAYQLGLLTSFLPAFLLSGFIFSIENMPAPIQAISRVFPTRYFVTILKGIFLQGAGLQALWGEVLLLAVYGLVVFLIAVRRMRQKVA